MEIVFRTDASLDIGTGHVMRCLTLADALRERGANCRFICRDHSGNLLDLIEKRGYPVHVLLVAREHMIERKARSECASGYSDWLGVDWGVDAHQTVSVLSNTPVEWLIVDHYALDARWEMALRAYCKKLLVIDDMADRPHVCELLLDQNLGREAKDYDALVPDNCIRLLGPQNALLRPDFAALREYSLERRRTPMLKHILIAMGGVDKSNAAGQMLEALKVCPLPPECRITVVMGGTAPWIERVRTIAARMPWQTEVSIDSSDMARLMAESDLSIGAAGSTSWERCCLGLPSLLVVLADNQKPAALHMSRTGVSHSLILGQALATTLQNLIKKAVTHPDWLSVMSSKAASVTDGKGSELVINAMMNSGEK